MAGKRPSRAGGSPVRQALHRAAAPWIPACAGMTILLALAGCADLPQREPAPPSPCDIHEASWECQIQRYRDVSQ